MLIGPVKYKNKMGYLSPSGDWAIEPKYDQLGKFRDGLAGICIAGKLGFIDENANIVIEPKYPLESPFSIWGFKEGMAPVQDDCVTYIDRIGYAVLRLPFALQGWHFHHGRSMCMDADGLYSVFDISGNVMSKLPIYEAPYLPDWPIDWDCFICWFKSNGIKVGAINWKGEMLFEPIYTVLGDFCNGVAPYSPDGEYGTWGLVRMSGEVVIKPTYFRIGNFSEGLAPAALSNKQYGYIDISGNYVISPKYDHVSSFDEGIACVTIKKKNGFINKNGEMIIEARFDRQSRFFSGYAEVEYANKRAIISRTGQIIWESKLDD